MQWRNKEKKNGSTKNGTFFRKISIKKCIDITSAEGIFFFLRILIFVYLFYFRPIFPFYTVEKHQKTWGFLFSEYRKKRSAETDSGTSFFLVQKLKIFLHVWEIPNKFSSFYQPNVLGRSIFCFQDKIVGLVFYIAPFSWYCKGVLVCLLHVYSEKCMTSLVKKHEWIALSKMSNVLSFCLYYNSWK